MSTGPNQPPGGQPPGDYRPHDSFPRGNPNDPRQTGYEEGRDNPAVTDGAEPKKRRFGCCLGCGVVGAIMLLVCCGGAAYLGDFFFGTLGEEFGRQVASVEEFRENVGDIKEISPNYSLMVEEVQRAQQAGEDPPIVYDVEGTKGSAVLVVTQDPESSEPVAKEAVLILPDGTRIPLEIKPGAGNVNEFEEDIEAMEGIGDFIDAGTVETDSPQFEPGSEEEPTTDQDEDAADGGSAEEKKVSHGGTKAQRTFVVSVGDRLTCRIFFPFPLTKRPHESSNI